MAIVHIVHFGYSCDEAQKKEIAGRFLRLQAECRTKGDNGQQYIQSITGGINNSKEGVSQGLEHTFVVKFVNLEDRDYYVSEDPVHAAFKDYVGGSVSKVIVMDFEEGVF